MRVLSLLPSATEIVYALRADDLLCGVSCDCDHPEGVATKPVVSSKVLPISEDSSPADIDAMVRNQLAVSDSIYALDRGLIQALRPDVILAQDLCRVCAVPSGDVEAALDVIGCRADVLSLDPHSLDDVIENVLEVGRALGTSDRAAEVVASLRDRLQKVRETTAGAPAPRVVALEWQDPPFTGGHWIPEMVSTAGGVDVIGVPGARSRTLEWSEVAAAAPDVVVFIPCGYGLDEAIEQLDELMEVDELCATPAALRGDIFVADSSAYFSRSGPRLVDGVEILAGIFHPDLHPAPEVTKALHVSTDGGAVITSPVGPGP